MLSVGIIVPSWHYFANPFKLQPLYELYFATVIDSRFQGRGVSVSVIDLRQTRLPGNKINWEDIASYIPEHDLYLYWITKTADYNEVLHITQQLRKVYPRAKQVAGGTHVDVFPEECERQFDAIVLGPGEESFIKIINNLHNGLLDKAYRSDWSLAKYADYPFARRHYLSEPAIINTALFEEYGAAPGTSALFSRGCNFRCIYCVYNVPPVIQMRSNESIEEEINYLKNEYNIKGVNLRDEICIPLSPKIAIPYLEAIGRSGVIWRGQTKVGATNEVIALARQTGCVELAVGVESASQRVLDIINKRQTVEQAKEFIKTCKSFGIRIKMCLILGLPGEPSDIVKITRSYIDEVQPDYVNISGFCPVPGSMVFNNAEYYGIRDIDEDWSKHAHLVFRFSDEEDFGLPFQYEGTNRWGKTFTRNEIVQNIMELQHYCRERSMTY